MAAADAVQTLCRFNRSNLASTQRIGLLSPLLTSWLSLTELRLLYALAHCLRNGAQCGTCRSFPQPYRAPL